MFNMRVLDKVVTLYNVPLTTAFTVIIVNWILSTDELVGIVVDARVWLMLISENKSTVPELPTASH